MTIGIHKKQKQIQGGKIPSYLFFFTHNLRKRLNFRHGY